MTLDSLPNGTLSAFRPFTLGVAEGLASTRLAFSVHITACIRVVRSIGKVVRMPVRAVSLGAMSSDEPRATLNVDGLTNHLEMRWANTSVRPANVVENAPGGDCAVFGFISEPMRKDHFSVAEGETAVALVVKAGSPDPAIGALINVVPEPLLRRKSDCAVRILISHRNLQSFGVTVPDVSASRHHSILPAGGAL